MLQVDLRFAPLNVLPTPKMLGATVPLVKKRVCLSVMSLLWMMTAVTLLSTYAVVEVQKGEGHNDTAHTPYSEL